MGVLIRVSNDSLKLACGLPLDVLINSKGLNIHISQFTLINRSLLFVPRPHEYLHHQASDRVRDRDKVELSITWGTALLRKTGHLINKKGILLKEN